MILTVDSHEPVEIYEAFKKHEKKDEITVQRKEITTGDYVLMGNNFMVICERKKGGDFYSSIKDGRLFEDKSQLERMNELSAGFNVPVVKFVAFIGSKAKLYREHPDQMGWINSSFRKVFTSYMIPVLTFVDDEEFIQFMRSIIHHPEEIGFFKPVAAVKKTSSLSPTVRMLMTIPGIGESKAKEIAKMYTMSELVSSFLCLNNVPVQSVQKYFGVKGVGDALWERIIDAVSQEWEE